MQKKIIMVAIAAALTTPALVLADTANVTVYGVAHASLDMVKTGDGVPAASATAGATNLRVSSNQSRIGLKGSESLGGGLNAVWQMEGIVDMDVGTSGLFNRNTFVGVAGDFGTVVLGRHDTPYKIATRSLDVFADTIADNRNLMGGPGLTAANVNNFLGGNPLAAQATAGAAVSFDGRQSNVLAYISPAMGGVTAAIGRVNLSEQNTLNTDTKITATSLAVMFGQGPIYASFAYETHSIAPNVGSSMSEKATKLGFGFTMDAFSVGAVVEKTSDDLNGGANLLGHTAMTVNGKFNITDSDAIKAAYVTAGKLGAAPNTDTAAKQISVGYDHNLSKRTTVYALYTKLSNDQNVNYGLFGGGGGYNTNAGASPSALSVGMKHSF